MLRKASVISKDALIATGNGKGNEGEVDGENRTTIGGRGMISLLGRLPVDVLVTFPAFAFRTLDGMRPLEALEVRTVNGTVQRTGDGMHLHPESTEKQAPMAQSVWTQGSGKKSKSD